MEQVADNRLIRPAARYVGPPPPQPVPARGRRAAGGQGSAYLWPRPVAGRARTVTECSSTHKRWSTRRRNFHPDSVRRYSSAYRMNHTTSVPGPPPPVASAVGSSATQRTAPVAAPPAIATRWSDTWWNAVSYTHLTL